MANIVSHGIQDHQRAVTLLDGRQAIMRPVCSVDKAAVKEFYARLSDESKFLRYHYTKGELTEGDLKSFCDIDYRDNFGLVVEIESNGNRYIIGMGRYCRLPGSDKAEVAFEVQDTEQRKGIGTVLLRYLADLAVEQGIHHFCGEVLRQNGKMLSIFRKYDPHMKQDIDDHTTCTVTLTVGDGSGPCLAAQTTQG